MWFSGLNVGEPHTQKASVWSSRVWSTWDHIGTFRCRGICIRWWLASSSDEGAPQTDDDKGDFFAFHRKSTGLGGSSIANDPTPYAKCTEVTTLIRRGSRPRIPRPSASGRPEYPIRACVPPMTRGTPTPISYIHIKLAVSHADNHLLHLTIFSDRFLPAPLCPGCSTRPHLQLDLASYHFCGH